MDSSDLIEGRSVSVPDRRGPRSVSPVPAGSRPAALAAAGTVVLWASAFPAIAVAVPSLGPVGLSVARLGVASAAIGAAVFLGVAPSAVGFVLWAHALRRMDVGRATTALYLVPAVAIIVALVWLGQVPGPLELLGGAIALAGVLLANRERH
jgi:drug/metabolite transporter (DMT)-like permease